MEEEKTGAESAIDRKGFLRGYGERNRKLHNQVFVKFKLHDTFAHSLQKIYKYLCKKQQRHNKRGETR